MKKNAIDRQRAIVADHQMAEIPQPGKKSAPRSNAVCSAGERGHLEVVSDGGSGAAARSAQCPAVAASFAGRHFISDHPKWLLPGMPSVLPSAYADRRERLLGEADFRRGCRVKGVFQRNTAAVDHCFGRAQR